MAAIAVEEHAFVEYLEIDFVDDVSEFQCVRCNRVLFQHYISNCGHAFCANCRRVVDDGSSKWKCPKCKEYIKKINVQDEELHRKLYELRAHCPNSKYGCDYVEQMKLIQNHLMQCEFTKEKALPKLVVNNFQEMRLALMNDELKILRKKIFQLEMKDKENEDKLGIKLNDIDGKINDIRIDSNSKIHKINSEIDNFKKNADVNLAVEECKSEITKFKWKSESWFELLDFKEEKLKKTISNFKLELEKKFKADLNDLKSQIREEWSESYKSLSEKYENASNVIADLKLNLGQQSHQIEELRSAQEKEMPKFDILNHEFGSKFQEVQNSIKVLETEINQGLENGKELKNEINDNKIKIDNLKLENEKVIRMIDEIFEKIGRDIDSAQFKHENIEKVIKEISSVVNEHQLKLINDFEKFKIIETEMTINDLQSKQKQFETEINKNKKKIKECLSTIGVLINLLDNKETRSESDKKIEILSQKIKMIRDELDEKSTFNEKQTKENSQDIENNCQRLSELMQQIVNKETIENLIKQSNNVIKLETEKSIKFAFESIIELENELSIYKKESKVDNKINANEVENIKRDLDFIFKSKTFELEVENRITFFDDKDSKSSVKKISDENTYNVLLLGPIGVGKSTLINALYNYLHFKTLAVAKESPFQFLIPFKFTLSDENSDERKIDVECDENKALKNKERSSTRECKVYKFRVGDKVVQIIDTPGIEDTEGVDQDRINVDQILTFVSQFQYLHSICILLKANEFALNIKHVLLRLHHTVRNNVTFVFTNSKSTFFTPGDTIEPLKKLLDEIKATPPHSQIPFDMENVFCLDNEALRFLISIKNGGSNYKDIELEDFSKSWDQSSNQCLRLIEYVTSHLSPHNVNQSTIVNETMKTVIDLEKPLAIYISNKLRILQQLKDKLSDKDFKGFQIGELMNASHINIKIVKLDKPQVICGKAYSSDRRTLNGGHENVCHYPCSCLDRVTTNVFDHDVVKRCQVFGNSEYCSNCNCSYKEHQHTWFDLVKDDQYWHCEKQRVPYVPFKTHMRELYELEENFREVRVKNLIKNTAKLSVFVEQNSVIRRDDVFDDHLKGQANWKCYHECFRSSYNFRQLTLNEYRSERRTLQNKKSLITTKEVEDIVNELTNSN